MPKAILALLTLSLVGACAPPITTGGTADVIDAEEAEQVEMDRPIVVP